MGGWMKDRSMGGCTDGHMDRWMDGIPSRKMRRSPEPKLRMHWRSLHHIWPEEDGPVRYPNPPQHWGSGWRVYCRLLASRPQRGPKNKLVLRLRLSPLD